MKKLITLLLLVFTMASCSTEEPLQRINQVTELAYPQESDPIADCPCHYIVFLSQDGDGSQGTIYYYAMDCQGESEPIYWNRTNPIPESQLDQWICN